MAVNTQPISMRDTETLITTLRSLVDAGCYLQTVTPLVWLQLRGGDSLI